MVKSKIADNGQDIKAEKKFLPKNKFFQNRCPSVRLSAILQHLKQVAKQEWPTHTKVLVAWSLATDGWISPASFEIGLENKNKQLMDVFWSYVKPIGAYFFYEKRRVWRWRVKAVKEILWVLWQIMPYLPAKQEKARKLIVRCLDKL